MSLAAVLVKVSNVLPFYSASLIISGNLSSSQCIQTLRKKYFPVFSCIEVSVLTGEIRVRESRYSVKFYVVKHGDSFTVDDMLFETVNLLILQGD